MKQHLSSFLLPLFFATTSLFTSADLEENPDDFILQTTQVHVPGFPHAFNPSLIRYNNKLLMSFRVIVDMQDKFASTIGLVWLNEDLQVDSAPFLLSFREEGSLAPIRVDDVRLVEVGGKLWLIYSDNPQTLLSKGGFRVHAAELKIDCDMFLLENITRFEDFPGCDSQKREKNWVPFDFEGQLLFAYSLQPHHIFQPCFERQSCSLLCSSLPLVDWPFGEMRGGTPALLEDERFISIFHSSIPMMSKHSNGREIYHYFMGAYTFSSQPPFELLQISKKFMSAEKFYSGPSYDPYWKPVKVVFPCGLVSCGEHYLISYGRDDHECWIATISKKKLVESLTNVH